MRPILYASNETVFSNNGLGVLHDCVTCYVEEERNGVYECSLTYPVDGIHYDEIGMRSLLKVKPNKYDDPQLFRIYSISKPLKGIVTIKAQHISYDLSGYPVSPFHAVGITQALQMLKSEAVYQYPFEFTTDYENEDLNYDVTYPRSVRSCLGGTEGSLLDVFGAGEYKFNNYNVYLYRQRGYDRGVTIKYGKNLTQLKQDETITNLYTGVYPYWQDITDGNVVEVENKIVPIGNENSFVRILPLNLSSEWDEAPTAEQLQQRTERYIEENRLGYPTVALTVSYESLDKYQGQEYTALLESVELCDTVTVLFAKLGVNAKAKVIKLRYDCLKERTDKVTIGNAKANMTDAMIKTQQEIDAKPNLTRMRATAESVSADILGASGGFVRFIDTDNDGQNDTLYIADNADPAQAVKVWRFNYAGWAGSSNGYNGPFTQAASLDSGMFADFITAGTLDANLIRAGIIQAALNGFYLNLEDGTFNFGNNRISYDGSTLNISADTINLGGAGVATNNSVQTAVDASATELNGNINTLRSDFESFAEDYNGFITIVPSEPSIALGKKNSPSNVKITNQKMIFTGSGNARAELGDSKFTVTQVETTSVVLGNYAWEKRSNGHISLKRVSG